MGRRRLLVLGMVIGLLVAAGSGRPGAASAAYSKPDCIETFERGPLTVLWRNAQTQSAGTGFDLEVARLLIGSTPRVIVGDRGEGDHWSVTLVDGLTDKELWRKDGLGPLERITIPESVLGASGLYTVKTERWLKDGRHTTNSTVLEITDHATYERLRGVTYGLDHSFAYALSQPGAVSARATLKVWEMGAVLAGGRVQMRGTGEVALTTLLYPERGRLLDGHPAVQLNLSTYLDAADTEKLLQLNWEQLDKDGRTLQSETDPVFFKVRAPLEPTWKQGGGQVISPTGTVEWEPIKGARWYRISIPDTGDGQAVEAVVPAGTTKYQFTTPLAPGFHWVNLAAEGGGCRQEWGDALPVVVEEEPFQGILSPTGPTLAERDLTVKLRRADWIEGYRVDLMEERNQSVVQTQSWSRFQGRDDTLRFSTDLLVPGRVYRLRATATLTIPVTLVDTVTFTYDPPARLALHQGLQGARVAHESLPLSWDPYPGATSYTLLLTRVSTFVNLQRRYSAGAATSLTLGRQELESGRTYRIVIEATMADGTKRTSDPVTFTIK